MIYYFPKVFYILIRSNFYEYSGCMKAGMKDFTSKESMEANGWIINVDQSQAIFNDTCEPSRNPDIANTWYGWAAYDAIGNATLFMKGHGSARLVYGNCHPFGTVKLYLNSVVISQAGPEEIKEIYFDYEHNAVLKLEEDRGIIKIHSLIWNCSSKIFFFLKASLQIIKSKIT